MRNPQIISLSAPRPQSGKDTLASQIVTEYGKERVACVAFGDYLRDCVSHLFGLQVSQNIRERLNDNRKDIPTEMCKGTSIVHTEYREFLLSMGVNLHEHKSPRWHMQHLGNDYVKGHLGLENFWVDVIDRRIARLVKTMPNLKFIIVTDTRSPNEFEWLKAHGAEFYMVKRAGFPKDAHDDTSNRHPVETHADNWKYDHVLWNQYGFPNEMLSVFVEHQLA